MPTPTPENGSEQQPNWGELIETAVGARPGPIRAMTYIQCWQTASKPAEFSAADGRTYVVKDGVAKRQSVNDQVVAVLAMSLCAPTGPVVQIEVSNELIQATPFLQQNSWVAGTWHGTLRVGDVTEREAIKYADVPDNRHRFALLAVLYGWAHTQHDHQFLYQKAEPHVVYSVDHGHFFPNGPDWDVTRLAGHTAPAAPDPFIVAGCNLTNAELKLAGDALAAIHPESVIVRAVAAPHDHWTDPPLTLDERVALAEYLYRRHKELVAGIQQLPA